MGRYGFFPYPRYGFSSLYPIIDILLLVGIGIILIHLFLVASIYVVALVVLMLLRMLIRPNPWRFGRIW
jgi:hypothetical protein